MLRRTVLEVVVYQGHSGKGGKGRYYQDIVTKKREFWQLIL